MAASRIPTDPLLARSTGTSETAPGSGSTNRADQVIKIAALALVFVAPVLIGVHSACAGDPDVWWHLRTGQWMLQHHAVPHTDPFSGTNAGKPWQAYSWLFELLAIKLFNGFGLASLVAYTAAMLLVILLALQHMIRRLQPDFAVVVILTLASCFTMGHLYMPRPWMFTILFFVLELDILMHARRTGKTRELLWLPLIFALWCNLHIEFIDGLLVLGLAMAEALSSRWISVIKTRSQPHWLAAILACSVLATLLNPFGWRVYSVVFDYTSRLAAQGGALSSVVELQANPFRDPGNFGVLFLTLAAAAVLGWGRRLRLFETGLLIFAAVESFRSQRDVWLVVIAAVAILASIVRGRGSVTTVRLPRFGGAFAAMAAALMVAVTYWAAHLNNRTIEAQIATTLPVHATAEIEAKGYPGPLFNDYNWGGYLMWAQKLPVSIDGRASFYGDAAIVRSMQTWNAEPDWASDPALNSAGVVIGPVKSPLIQVLRRDPHFKLAFEDKVAAVFIPRR